MSHAAPPAPTVDPVRADLVPAGLEPRFLAYVLDRVVGWGVSAGVAVLVWRLLAPDHVWVAIVAFVACAVLVGLVMAMVLGTTGTSPGKAAFGLRVVRRSDGRPIGAGPAVLRAIVLGIGGLPTLGLGCATLAWTALNDADGTRRALHDRFGEAVVVDVRPQPEPTETDEAPQPKQVVNLTAMRLLPDPEPVPVTPQEPTPAPALRPAAAPAPSVPMAPAPPLAPASPAPAPVPSAPAPAPAGSPAAAARRAAPAPTHRWRVAFDTGETFVVEGLALVGRRPEARAGEPVRHLVALRSADMSLSKTHAQFQVASDGALVVMDRGSTNGSSVVRRGHERPLNPGRPSTLIDGDAVKFGDRTMQVTRES